jgi:peroxin-11B
VNQAHKNITQYTRPLLLTKCAVGRDKTLRTIQYFSRFLAWYLYRTNHSQSTVDVFNGVKKNFGSVRKAMRLTKFIEHFKLAAVASDANTSDPVVKYLAVGRQLGYAFYMLLDNMTYPDVAGIKKFSAAARLQKEAYRAWCVGLTCNVVAGLYALYNLRLAEQKQVDSADAEKAVEVKKLAKYVFCDFECSVQPRHFSNYRDLQGQERRPTPAHLRPLRLDRSHQRSRPPQLGRRYCRSCRYCEQFDWSLRRVAEDCVSA